MPGMQIGNRKSSRMVGVVCNITIQTVQSYFRVLIIFVAILARVDVSETFSADQL